MRIDTTTENIDNYKKYLQVTQLIDQYLQQNNYLKIDLPVLSPALIPEGYLEVFETEFKYLNKKEKLYLTPSPELFLKRLLAHGVGDCYYLGKTFRNSELISSKHTPEFTMLELYKVGARYLDIADVVLGMLQHISKSVYGKTSFNYLGREVDVTRWEKLSVAQAFQKYANITADELFNQEKFVKKAADKGYVIYDSQTNKIFSYEDLWSQIYSQEVEPQLGKNGHPTLLYEYPKEFASLAKHNDDGKTARRFEFYIEGIELGNCYEELTDWQEQEKRFHKEAAERETTEKTNHPIDTGFIEALKHGLPACSGIAIGVERLGMIFTDLESIEKLKLISVD